MEHQSLNYYYFDNWLIMSVISHYINCFFYCNQCLDFSSLGFGLLDKRSFGLWEFVNFFQDMNSYFGQNSQVFTISI